MKCEVLYVERSMYEGVDPDCPWPSLARRAEYRSWLAADFGRRFRPAYRGPGWSAQTVTLIVAPGTEWTREAPDPPLVKMPRYAKAIERWLWRPIYWLRNRWDGLRYGLDRDRKS